jgi:protein gp37
VRACRGEAELNKTKIDWADYTWNPIKGLCPEACWYCYARAMYRRFKLDERLEFHVTRGEIAKMDRLPDLSRIFICSTMEIFHPSVKVLWRDRIFQTIEMFPKHTFIILTKRPERIDRPMPDNVWLGVSVEGEEDWGRVRELQKIQTRIRFASLEPLLGTTPSMEYTREIDWLIVGRLTGHGRKHDPEAATLCWLKCRAREFDIPIFMKNNLKDIWNGPLIQEFPK